jgi:TPR repeat protein
MMYEEGYGVAQSDTEAAEWYQRAANRGHAEAQYFLGKMYSEGRDVAQSYAEAFEWYRKAANRGHAEAQHKLGLM